MSEIVLQQTMDDFEMKNMRTLVFNNDSKKIHHPSIDIIRKKYNSLITSTHDEIQVTYKPPKCGVGNFQPIEDHSLKNVKSVYLKLLVKKMNDIDMVASGPNIMSQEFMKMGLDTKELSAYIQTKQSRERVLKLINPNRSEAKRTFERAFNGGKRPGKIHEEVKKILDEVDFLRKEFYVRSKRNGFYSHIFRSMETKDISKLYDPETQLQASFMARVKDDIQSKCLEKMVDFIGKDHVFLLNCDGLISRIEIDLKKCEKFVLEKTGYKIKLAYKSLKPTPEDLTILDECNIPMDWGGIPVYNNTSDDMVSYVNKTTGEMKKSIRPLVFDDNVWCNIVVSHCGSGKTKANLDVVHKLRMERGDSLRVLFVSCRMLQARDISNLYGLELPYLKHYKDIKGKDELFSSNQLVIQYESLHRLEGLENQFDLFVLDETRQVLAQSCSVKTNKFILQSFEVLKALLCGLAKKVILCDADMEFDGMVRDLISHPDMNMFKDKTKECVVHRYMDYQPLPKRFLVYDDDVPLITDLLDFFSNNRKKKNKVRVFAFFRTKTKCECVLKFVKHKLQWLKTLEIHSDSPKEILESCSNIDRYIEEEEIDFMGITSKITVGLDIQTPFDREYLFANGSGASPLNTTQGLDRPRNLIDKTVRAVFGRDMYVSSIMNYDKALHDFRTDAEVRRKYAIGLCNLMKWQRDDNTGRCGKWKFVIGSHEMMFAHTHAMEKTSFRYNFDKLCYQKGWTMSKHDTTKGLTPENIETLKQLNNTRRENADSVLDLHWSAFVSVITMDIDDWDTLLEDQKSEYCEPFLKYQCGIVVALSRLGVRCMSSSDRDDFTKLITAYANNEELNHRGPGKEIKGIIESTPRMRRFRLYEKFIEDSSKIGDLDRFYINDSNTVANFTQLDYRDFTTIHMITKQLTSEDKNFDSYTEFNFTGKDINRVNKELLQQSKKSKVPKKDITMMKTLFKSIGLDIKLTGSRSGADRVQNYKVSPSDLVLRYSNFVNISPDEEKIRRVEFKRKRRMENLRIQNDMCKKPRLQEKQLQIDSPVTVSASSSPPLEMMPRLVKPALCSKPKPSYLTEEEFFNDPYDRKTSSEHATDFEEFQKKFRAEQKKQRSEQKQITVA